MVREITIGTKTFKVKDTLGYRALNKLGSIAAKVSQGKLEQEAVNDYVLKEMVLEPVIDEAYLDGAGIEEFQLSIKLTQEATELLTTGELKKKLEKN